MIPEKPKSFDELEVLIKSGDIEVLDSEDRDDGLTWVTVYDRRMSYEVGEIYDLYL